MNLWRDLRLAARILIREPAFTSIAILMLALGIGATTTTFSVVNGVLLKPLSYHDPERLVSIREVASHLAHLYPTVPVNARHFVEWRRQCPSFEGMSAIIQVSLNLTGSGEPERLEAASVSPNLFRVLGVRVALGRDFLDEEEQRGRDNVVVLTDGLWRRRFHADPSLVGKTIRLNGLPHTVVGVLPPDFRYPNRNAFGTGESVAPQADLFRPLSFRDDELAELLGRHNYAVIARLKPGVTRQRAGAELEAVQLQMIQLAGAKTELRAHVTPLLDTVVGNAGRGLIYLLCAVGVVLLIVCVNLANLLLARGERRAREAAVRTALGAGRAQLLRGALAEVLIIGLAGGGIGLGAAAFAVAALRRSTLDIPRLNEVQVDAGVLIFALGLTLLTCLLFGLLPAWRTSRADPQQALKAGGRTATESRSGLRIRSLLVTAEVALSAVLLITAGLLMNSFVRLMRVDKGFSAPTVLAVDLAIEGPAYGKREQREAFYQRLLNDLSSRPGVQAAAICTALPLQGETWIDQAYIPGLPESEESRILVNVRFVSADYFRTMGIPLRAGRTFSDNDRDRRVALISERLAQRLWPGRDAVGRTFSRGNNMSYEVIGVVGDVRAEVHKPPVSMVYRPYWDPNWVPFRSILVARAAGDPRSVAGAMRAAIRATDPDVPVPQMRTISEVLDESVAQRRFQMTLAGSFAFTALLLACLGIYGVVSYSVARRTGEMGIRAALGARPADLYRLVLRQGLAPVAVGLLLGIASALAAGNMLASLLFEIRPRDPFTIVAVSALLTAVSIAACLLPARRAAGVEPAAALKYE
ncbi:MAG TPA: ABC transporter permease [Bryobacteraceae bacterium]|nr:ABC transporter permease [Bryobacteraceae bacterium]HPU73946.1 ABC transporter permease [Bryobacteraceae bacterium]